MVGREVATVRIVLLYRKELVGIVWVLKACCEEFRPFLETETVLKTKVQVFWSRGGKNFSSLLALP